MITISRPEAVRQSTLAKYDQCPLSARFSLESEMRQAPGTGGVLAARGVLFHRFAAAAINYMRSTGETQIPVAQSMTILARVLAQHEAPNGTGGWSPVADDEVVHVPMSEIKWLRVLATKWTYQNAFSIDRVVEVERRLYADIEVVGPGGQPYQRRLTGQPDVLLAGPARDEATVVDWKSGFAPPSRVVQRDGTEHAKLSDMGFVQQIIYGYLSLKNFPVLNRVTEREVYVFWDGEVREATVLREDIERIEDLIATQIALLDAAIDSTPELTVRQQAARDTGQPVPQGRWLPIPGSHCGFCSRRRDCPIRDEVGIPDTLVEAQALGREWLVAAEIRKDRTPLVKGWIDAQGPIPIAHSKGRREIGYSGPGETGSMGKGKTLKLYEPEDADDSPFDEMLADAAPR